MSLCFITEKQQIINNKLSCQHRTWIKHQLCNNIKYMYINCLLILQEHIQTLPTVSAHVSFSECLNEIWKGDLGVKGSGKITESNNEKDEHDAGELWHHYNMSDRLTERWTFGSSWESRLFLMNIRNLKPFTRVLMSTGTS